jgi:hypothetical protein
MRIARKHFSLWQIVPPNQAEMMFNAIKAKKIPCALLMFKGISSSFLCIEFIV